MMSDIERIADLQREMNELRERRWAFLMEYHGGVLPRTSRRLWIKHAVRRRVWDWRRRIAQVLDPD